MSTTTESHELYFSVDAGFIMNLARERYWFEGAKEWALDALSCFQGITTEQTMKVLRGEARLSGVSRHGAASIEYIEEPDTEFQSRLREYQEWLRESAIRKAEELAKESIELLNSMVEDNPRILLSPEDEALLTDKSVLLRQAARLKDEFFQPRPEKPKTLSPPEDPIQIGAYTVSKKLLESYIEIAKDHELMEPWTPSGALYYSGKMMAIHLQLRESVGLEGFWGRTASNEPDDFDTSLQAVVHSYIKRDRRYMERELRRRANATSIRKEQDGGIPYSQDEDSKGD
jgi:hypothetical protein